MAESSGNGGDKTKLILHVHNYEYYANPYEVATPKYKNGYNNWFIVTDDDISSSSSSSSDARVAAGEGRILHPIRRMFVEFPTLTTSVYVDSTIYVLGGWEFPPYNRTKDMFSRDFRYIDTSAAADDASSGGWIRGPPMLFPRVKPCVVVVDRKMYVFGGNQSSLQRTAEPCPWAEVFDIQSQKWSELPVPIDITEKEIEWGSALNLDVVVEGHKMNKFILLYHYIGALLYYDFVKDIWGTFDENFGERVPWQLVLSGGGGTHTNNNTMYVFAMTSSSSNDELEEDQDYEYTLDGYDLSRRKWFPVTGLLDVDQVAPRWSQFVDQNIPTLHIISRDDGRLCVLWASLIDFPGPLCVRLTEFMVTLVNDSVLLAKANPTRFLLLDDATTLIDCLTTVCYRERKAVGNEKSEQETAVVCEELNLPVLVQSAAR